MKAGESFKLDAAWWKAGKPNMLKTTGLGAALTTYTTARAAWNGQKANNQKFEAVVAALQAVETARVRAFTLCGKDYSDTKAALNRNGVIATEMAAIKASRQIPIASALKRLKTRTTDLKTHNANLKGQVDKYIAEAAGYTDQQRADMKKKIELNLQDYTANAINGGQMAIADLQSDLALIKKYYPALATDFDTSKTAFEVQRTLLEHNRDAAEKAFEQKPKSTKSKTTGNKVQKDKATQKS
jgi:hypothetical protein